MYYLSHRHQNITHRGFRALKPAWLLGFNNLLIKVGEGGSKNQGGSALFVFLSRLTSGFKGGRVETDALIKKGLKLETNKVNATFLYPG